MFRRSSADATEGNAQGSQGTQTPEAPAKSKPVAEAGKGRPTPKRSQAEANRYRTITGTTTSGRGRTASSDPKRKLTPEEKAKARSERDRQLSAMRAGEDWALGSRDRGPLKKLTRDYVDAHRRPMEYYMYALILLIIALFSSSKHKSGLGGITQDILIGIIAVLVVDALLLRRSVLKLAHERLPGESTRGITFYAVMRGLQLRRFRTPKPRLKPGDDF